MIPHLSFIEKLICRSFCRFTPPSYPRTFSPIRPRAPHRHYRFCIAPPLCSTFACCQADYICDMGVIFGLLDMVGCDNLRPRERNIIYGCSSAKTWCPLAGNQLSVALGSHQCGFYSLCSIASTAFVFSSSWTIPLYACLRGSVPPTTTTKRRRRRSFKTLVAASVAITVALVLPLCVFASPSNGPVSTLLYTLMTTFKI